MSRERSRSCAAIIIALVFGSFLGCKSSNPVQGIRKSPLFSLASAVFHRREDPRHRHYLDALKTLESESQFDETVILAREAEDARRDSDPRSTALYAKVALDCWPKLSSMESRNRDEQSAAVWEVYHHSVAQFVQQAKHHGQLDPIRNVTLTVDDEKTVSIPITHHGFPWSADDFGELRLAEASDKDSVKRYWITPGLGVPLVAISQVEQRSGFISPQVPFAATCILRPSTAGLEKSGSDVSGSDTGVPAVLELQDPLRIRQVSYQNQQWDLTRDLSAPLALVAHEVHRDKFSSFLDPGRPESKANLRMIEPYQKGKRPLVFVHGLLSDRFTWADLVNDLRSVNGLSEHYQIWSFQYPTGQPFVQSAAELRKSLYKIVRDLDQEGNDEALTQMVLIGHSMGGLVSKLQVTESKSAIWDSVASRGVDQIQASPEIRHEIEQLFFFEPSPYVKRVIFIGTPHLGSPIAKSFVGKLGTALVHTPSERATQFKEFIHANPDLFAGELTHRIPSSIDLLRPDNPMLLATYKLPVNPAVRLHTIIGTGGELSGGIPADGVVAVESARHPGTVSECLIEAKHTHLTGHEETTKEMVRILGDHLIDGDKTESDERVATTVESSLLD